MTDKMTTNDHVPSIPATDSRSQAAPITGGLSTDEVKALKSLLNGDEIEDEIFDNLIAKKLVYLAPYDDDGIADVLYTDLGWEVRKALGDQTAAAGETGWYYSSVVQWIPEYSTIKINGYSGPFETWQDACEACFNELDKDMDVIRDQRQSLRAENEAHQAEIARLRGLCGQAAEALGWQAWINGDSTLVDDLRKAAKGGE